MKQSVKITVITICSLIIALAIVGFVFAALSARQCEAIIDAHGDGDAWFNTEEYAYYESMYSVCRIQMTAAIAVAIFASSLLICALFWAHINSAASNPSFFLSVILNTKTIKLHIPFEIIGITIGVIVYLVFQFVVFNQISKTTLALFGVLLLLLNIVGAALLITTLATIIRQMKDERFASKQHKAKMQ